VEDRNRSHRRRDLVGSARGTIVLVEAATGKVTDVLALQACAQK